MSEPGPCALGTLRQKPAPGVPPEGTSKDTGPRVGRRAKSKCKCEERWSAARRPGGRSSPGAAVGAGVEVAVAVAHTRVSGQAAGPSCLPTSSPPLQKPGDHRY
ncbi:hypothetical protein Cadr_000000913 [Camelus dromedarius]|uniref:Uncharacterized protein n=1 Tax=Camelus dromedarius TaxID=9838 RepID=A0A5N4EK61_CAMDR|nr:hypothetical protein Cadr_000000913 [Camelus dromedarius]